MKTETASVAQLKSALSKYLAKARAGQIIEVTSHRKVVARVTGIPDTLPDGLARMVAHGRLTPGNGMPLQFGPLIKLSDGGPLPSEIILEDRGPR
jgi:antitoxin (DNA-binding transcriptional repressor) of toxin-antitoxin stability system